MTIDIERYRSIAQAEVHRVLADEQGNKLIKAEQGVKSWKTRFVSWISRQTGSTSQTTQAANRQSFDKFKASLEKTYGKTIADRVDMVYLQRRKAAGGNLSSRTIKNALETADYYRNRDIFNNMARGRQFCMGKGLKSVFRQVAGVSMNNLDKTERFKLRRKVAKAIYNDPRFKAGPMTPQQRQEIADSVVQDHLQRRSERFATRFQHLSQTPQLANAGDVNDVMKTLKGLEGSDNTREAAQALREALTVIGDADEVLSQTPMSYQEIKDYNTDLDILQDGLQQLQHKLAKLHEHPDEHIRNIALAMLHDVNRPLRQIIEKKEYVKAFQENRPLSAQNVLYAKTAFINAAIAIIDEEDANTNDPEKNTKLRKLRATLKWQLDGEGYNADLSVQDQKDWAIKGKNGARAKYEKALIKQLKSADISSNGLEKRFHQAHTDALNKMDWPAIHTQVKFTLNGQMRSVQSEVTPAKHVAHQDDPLTKSYIRDGINGVSSESDHVQNHALNCATSKLLDGNTEIFSGVRHGIHSTRGLPKGSPERRTANFNHARETIQVALHNNQALLQEAIQKAGRQPPEAIEMPVSSLSLVTPSSLNDKTHWENQRQAWQDINEAGPLQFKVRTDDGREVTVRVKPKVLAFNFGVNPLAMGAGSGIDAIGWGWKRADQTNKESLQALLGGLNPKDPIGGMVGHYLNRDDVSAEDKRIVRELARQVRQIWTEGSYRHKEGDLFKMTSRLAVLTHRIGATPMWNCRSGKDRTGHLDAEAKMLAAEIHYTGQVPDYGPLSEERKKMFTEFAMHTGNLEIQQYNTGLPGYKTYNVSDNLNRLAGDSAKEVYTSSAKSVPH